jgi:hypothetical protein
MRTQAIHLGKSADQILASIAAFVILERDRTC